MYIYYDSLASQLFFLSSVMSFFSGLRQFRDIQFGIETKNGINDVRQLKDLLVFTLVIIVIIVSDILFSWIPESWHGGMGKTGDYCVLILCGILLGYCYYKKKKFDKDNKVVK